MRKVLSGLESYIFIQIWCSSRLLCKICIIIQRWPERFPTKHLFIYFSAKNNGNHFAIAFKSNNFRKRVIKKEAKKLYEKGRKED